MNRLRIIDDRQYDLPTEIRQGLGGVSTAVSYNGEIYWAANGANGHVPESLGDEASVLLSAIDCGTYVDGMYAAAFVDNGSLSVVRDPFGIKPLYIRRAHDHPVISSDLPAIVTLDHHHTINAAYLTDILCHGRLLGTDTIYSAIERVPPGKVMRFDPTGCESSRDLCSASQFPFEGNSLKARLAESMSRCLKATRSVGLALSGGVDSTILATAASVAGVEELATVSLILDETDDGVAELSQLTLSGNSWKAWKHYTSTLAPQRIPELTRRAVRLGGQPTRMTSWPLYVALAELANQAELTVLISGEGADELFGGYDSFMCGSADGPDSSLQRLFWDKNREVALEKLFGLERMKDMHADVLHRARRSFPNSRGDQVRHVELQTRLQPLLERTDHALMAYSIEGRTPYLHGGVPDWAFDMVPEGGDRISNKRALRAEWADAVEQRHLLKRKTHFRIPTSAWIAGPLKPELGKQFRRHLKSFQRLGIREQGLHWLLCSVSYQRTPPAIAEICFTLLTMTYWFEWLDELGITLAMENPYAGA